VRAGASLSLDDIASLNIIIPGVDEQETSASRQISDIGSAPYRTPATLSERLISITASYAPSIIFGFGS
jgi:hypothetical protein